jgi:NADPH:quinone reductase-like Zn-dependent oxidoreductase
MDLQYLQQRDERDESQDTAPLTPAGSNFVGLVQRCSTDISARYGIAKGNRVASLIQCGGNARYVKVPPDQLFSVPHSLDSADIAALLASHLPAFQALHHGRSRPNRYSTSCLRGKRVLIAADGATLEVQALVRLIQYAGASEIYVSVPLDHRDVLRRHRVAVLSDDPADWLAVVQGSMDVVVDYSFPRNFSATRASLARKGRITCCPQRNGRVHSNSRWMSSIEWSYILERYQLSLMKRATLFDFKEYVEQYRPLVLDDVAFLLSLLATRKIRPHVDRFITLSDVPKAHDEIQSNIPLAGAIICEPWKE